jgi:hypothetical protein
LAPASELVLLTAVLPLIVVVVLEQAASDARRRELRVRRVFIGR